MPKPTLTGTGRIADDLYLLAHDDVTGKPLLQARALGTGLAAALLAELLFAGSVWVSAERIELTGRGRPGDVLGRQILGLLLADRERHSLRDWLLFLGAEAEQAVAERLVQAGYVMAVNARLPWRKQRWVPAG